MKQTIRLNKSELKHMISESVKKVLKEMNNDYEGNDLDYETIKMEAEEAIYTLKQKGGPISWMNVAKEMGFRLETLNDDDMELLKDTIEEVMLDDSFPHWKEDMEFEQDFKNLPITNESRKKANNLTDKILAEVTKKLKGNKKLNEEYYPEDDDMMDDYYYGMMVTFSIEGIMEDDLTEEAVQNLINTKEEYCENSHKYCSVMVTKVDVQRDEFNDFEITVEAAVSAPEMPIDAIEEDAEDQIWYWFENKTNTRATRVVITDEREVFDNRTEKYKPKQKMNESVDYDDYASILNALAECGWAFTDSYDVRNRTTGQQGVRYIIEPYPNNLDGIEPFDVEQMKQKMIQFIGKDNVIFSEGQHRQAPEIKNLSMVVFENEESMMNESANMRYKGFKCVNTSDDPSFPTYAIISPQGETIADILFPSEMKEIVDEYLNGEW